MDCNNSTEPPRNAALSSRRRGSAILKCCASLSPDTPYRDSSNVLGTQQRGGPLRYDFVGQLGPAVRWAHLFFALAITGARADTFVLPTFDVVATTPLGGNEIDVARYPGAVWQTGAQDIQTFNDTTLTDTLARSAPGVTVGNVSGNEFEPDLFYRGFDATAVTGTPQGLAVYQNGTSHQRGVRRRRQLGPHPGQCDRQDDDHRRQTRSSASTRSAAPSP